MDKLEYLYGVSEAVWKDLAQAEAIELQNHLSEELLDELFVTYYNQRDIKRINAIIRVIKKNIALLKNL